MPTLHWLTREADSHAAAEVPYRLLELHPDFGTGAPDTGNMLIQGDNLEALKALLPFYAGQVKCIYIDPPYNTRSAFEHYDDNLEHTRWLGMMWPRLELLRELLSEDGSIWVSIDDNEAHYLKVIMDEIFGRSNFIGNAVWEKSDSPRMDAVFMSSRHDNTLCFAKDVARTSWNRVPQDRPPKHYNRKDEDGRAYYLKPLRAMGGQGDSKEARPSLYFALIAPDGSEVFPVRQDGSGGAWRWSPVRMQAEAARIEWVSGRNGWIPYFRIYADDNATRPVETIWPHEQVGSNRTSKSEIKRLFPQAAPFATPKPEALLQRIVQTTTNPGDLVLDSFLGSGTTAAVAHKMGRRYIGIEMGEHAVSHCSPRLKQVIEGEQGGISKSVGWQGGGGFRFYRLGPPVFDSEGRICRDIGFQVLAAHLYFSETGCPWPGGAGSPLLGIHDGVAYSLLYNGVLGDTLASGGNVLTRATLIGIRKEIAERYRDFAGSLTIYGEQSRLMPETLAREGIVFKQTPYDIKVRT